MPKFVFNGAQPMTYPESRDAQGQLLRTVEPGDEREFGEAPDHMWSPAGDTGTPEVKGKQAAVPGAGGDAGGPQDDSKTGPGE